LAWRGEVHAPRIGQLLSNLDQAQGQGTTARHTLGVGRMDHGASMEVGPTEMLMFAIGVALMAMWMDRK
jgi:hypothetical protein